MVPQDEIDRQPLLDTQQNQLGALLNHSASIDAKALGLLATTVAILIFIGQAKLAAAKLRSRQRRPSPSAVVNLGWSFKSTVLLVQCSGLAAKSVALSPV